MFPIEIVDEVGLAMGMLNRSLEQLREHFDECTKCLRYNNELKQACFRASVLILNQIENENRVIDAKKERGDAAEEVEKIEKFFKAHSDPLYKCIRPQ